MTNFRLLPSTILLLGVMMVTKSYYAYHTGKDYYNSLVSDSYAQDEKEAEEKKSAAAKTEEKKDEGKQDAKTVEKEGEKNEGDKKEEAGNAPSTEVVRDIEDKKREKYTQTELDLLQSLSKRREELDQQAKELSMREDVLKAAEVKLDKKIDSLKALKDDVEKLLAQYNEHETAKIKSLVKIYESMKPAQAAEIFNQLDNSILLRVIDNMKEAKAAPILANMKPEKAKQITIELANAKKLPDKVDTASDSKPATLPPPAPPQSN